MPIISNQSLGGSVVIRSTSNETFSMAAFQGAGDAALNVTVNAVTIRKILASTDGLIQIGRVVNASTNAIMFNLSFSLIFDLDATGCASGYDAPLDYPNCALYINHSSANSVVTIKLKKQTVPQAEWNNDTVPGLINSQGN